MDLYDRHGQPIDLPTWCRYFEDETYKHVAWNKVGPYEVSTIWLGIDHNWGGRVPHIFETMIFDPRIQVPGLRGETYPESIDCWRYATEEAALAGHDQAVAWAREHVDA